MSIKKLFLIDENKDYFFSKLLFQYRKSFINTKDRSHKFIDHNFLDYNRTKLLKFIIKNKKVLNYLEIGCDNNDNFNQIDEYLELKVGVDPERGGNIRKTSDQFFIDNNDIFDLIFLDGLHTCKQTFKDFVNSLSFSKIGTFILFHDCLPINFSGQVVPREQLSWTGDIWKIFFLIHDYKINYKIGRFDSGCGLVQVNEHLLEIKNTFDINKYDNLSFDYFYENYKKLEICNIKEIHDFIKIY